MIDPDGKHYEILSHGTINGLRHEHYSTAAFKPWDCVEHDISTPKVTRATDDTIYPDDGVINT